MSFIPKSLAFLAAAASGLAGCGAGEPDWSGPTADTLGPQKLLAYKDYLAQAEYVNTDLGYGERLSQQCQKCHTLGPDEGHGKGPNLFGFIGSRAGSRTDFPHSDALTSSDFRWTPRALDAWMAAPKGFLPGNDMRFSGLPDPDARAALIAYLLTVTDDTGRQE